MNTAYAGSILLFPQDVRSALLKSARSHKISIGETLFREGDESPDLFMLVSGKCVLSRNAEPLGEARPDDLLDPAATLGGLPHSIRATAITDCEVLHWPVEGLWQNPQFATAARRYLSRSYLDAKSRLDELAAPVHYRGESAQLPAGPFVFKNVAMIIALCEANLDSMRDLLPDGLSLFRPAWRRRDSLFIAMADFPLAYPDHTPSARFRYTETTFFVPARYKGKLGLFAPYIYPSTYEPVLLGREIYGFPKRLGETVFDIGLGTANEGRTTVRPYRAALSVDGESFFDFSYRQTESAGEPRLVRALSDWMGIPGRVTEAAFRIGDALLDTMGAPLYRRVSVYNHKRIPAATTTQSDPVYAVDELTQAVFSVTHWHEISRITDGRLTMLGGPLHRAEVALRDAYFTRLDMRLSTGRVRRDYTR